MLEVEQRVSLATLGIADLASSPRVLRGSALEDERALGR
jgi:hypothetical protein